MEDTFWLNIDKVDKLGTLHTSKCNKRIQEETANKGINRLKNHGGWFSFQNPKDAKEELEKLFPRFKYHECNCIRKN